MYNMLNSGIGWLARVMAILGGIVLIAVIIITCLAIIERDLVPHALNWLKPGFANWAFELIEVGMAFAIFAFLPWCQYSRGHARVDLFLNLYGSFLNRVIDLVADVMMFIAAYVIAWRLYAGMMDKYNYHETTFVLQFEIWMGYAAGFVGAVVFVIVSAFCILRSLRALFGQATEVSA